MTRYPPLLALLALLPACAMAGPCEDLPQPSAARPIQAEGTLFCFVQTRPLDEPQGAGSSMPHAISIFASRKGHPAEFFHELPYSSTASRIDDAFLAPGSGPGRLVVLHSSDVPSTFEIAGRLHDVTVVDLQPAGPRVNEPARTFFDIGGDITDAKGDVVFRYPYKTRSEVIAALGSPLFAASEATPVKATVSSKASLYPEPDPRIATRSYLIEGDHVATQSASGGWCQIRYKGKSKEITRWMECAKLRAID